MEGTVGSRIHFFRFLAGSYWSMFVCRRDGGCGAKDVRKEGWGQRDRGLKSWDVLVTLVLGPICDLYIQDSQT